MDQVLDFFNLLDDRSKDDRVVWRLVSASTNSPLTIIAEATSFDPAVDVTFAARLQKKILDERFHSILQGETPMEWRSTPKADIAKRLFSRAMNGVGSTEVFFQAEGKPNFTISPEMARASYDAIVQTEAPVHTFKKHRERGSIEGRLLEITTYRSTEAAIRVEERRTGAQTICTISAKVRDEIDGLIGASEVWNGVRVRVAGWIVFNDRGKVTRVESDSISFLPSSETSLEDLYDKDFTGGLSAAEYLNRLREGELG